MSSVLGAAVVGTGFGVITHARALDAAGIEVRALVGRDPEKTAQRAALYGIPHATTDRAEAFGRDDIDVVAVTTPPHTHAEIVLDAVAAGKHVLCEKPFARDLDEAREMLRAAEAAGVVHLLGTEFRFAPGQALLTRTVRSGAHRRAPVLPLRAADPDAPRSGGRDAGVVGRRGARRRLARRARHPRPRPGAHHDR